LIVENLSGKLLFFNFRYVLVKRLGPNPSQIDGIEIYHHISSQLKPDQTLYIVNMKYPHQIVFEGAIDLSNQIKSFIQGL